MAKIYISKANKISVQNRAHFHCEYCLSPCEIGNTSCAIKHIRPVSKSGKSVLTNLALSCHGCNWNKSDKMKAVDPTTQIQVSLFNPRTQLWTDHFSWSDDCLEIIPLTATGRATIQTLKMNRSGLVNIRRILLLAGLHPPDFQN